MKNDIAQSFLASVMDGSADELVSGWRKYFQTMARFKYDDYQQFSPGMRFFEKLSLWLKQFDGNDRVIALNFVHEKLIFVSQAEMNLLITSAFPDLIRDYFMKDVALELAVPEYAVLKIVNSINYKLLLRQTLFCGMSDGAKMEIFRRANPTLISHEQVYQTYELSAVRAGKMQEELSGDVHKIKVSGVTESDCTFKRLFLLDDFSASGTSYLKYNKEKNELKGKIAALYKSVFENEDLKKIFDIDALKVYVVIYLCTEQAKSQIEAHFNKLEDLYGNKPILICSHIIPNTEKLTEVNDGPICGICKKDAYYDKEIEDKHTREGGSDVKLGFGKCALPLVLAHNTPNNSIPILWSYDTSSKFIGLFPRIPRHREI
jgi:hypothetical protein